MNTIYIMWLRQLKKYLRSKPRMLGSLGQPILYLLAFGYGFGSIYARAGKGDYMQFLAPGIITMSVIFTAIFSGIELIWDRQFGFLKETMVAPVSRFNIMLGRTLGGATVATLQGVIVFVLSLLFGFRPESWAMLPLTLVFTFLIALVVTILGTSIAARMSDMQAFPIIMNFVVMPLYFLSGALFPLDSASKGIQAIGNLNPLSYGVDAMHITLINVSHYGLALDFAVLALSATALLTLGSYLFNKIQI